MDEDVKNEIVGEIVELSRKIESELKEIGKCEDEIEHFSRRLEVLKAEKERNFKKIDELYGKLKG